MSNNNNYQDTWKWEEKDGVYTTENIGKKDDYTYPNLIFHTKKDFWIARAKRVIIDGWAIAKIVYHPVTEIGLKNRCPYDVYFNNKFYDASESLTGAMDIANFWL
jgi:hypothetical protein